MRSVPFPNFLLAVFLSSVLVRGLGEDPIIGVCEDDLFQMVLGRSRDVGVPGLEEGPGGRRSRPPGFLIGVDGADTDRFSGVGAGTGDLGVEDENGVLKDELLTDVSTSEEVEQGELVEAEDKVDGVDDVEGEGELVEAEDKVDGVDDVEGEGEVSVLRVAVPSDCTGVVGLLTFSPSGTSRGWEHRIFRGFFGGLGFRTFLVISNFFGIFSPRVLDLGRREDGWEDGRVQEEQTYSGEDSFSFPQSICTPGTV